MNDAGVHGHPTFVRDVWAVDVLCTLVHYRRAQTSGEYLWGGSTAVGNCWGFSIIQANPFLHPRKHRVGDRKPCLDMVEPVIFPHTGRGYDQGRCHGAMKP